METQHALPMRKALGFGWDTAIGNFGYWIGLFLMIMVVAVVIQVLEHFAKELSLLLYVNLALVGAAFQAIINAGFVAITLKFCDGEKPSLMDFLVTPVQLGKFFLGYLLYGLIIFVGLLLLIVPGLIWAVKYFPMVYLILDKDRSVGDALRESAQLTAGKKGTIAVFFSLQFCVNLLGFCALVVGLFVTVPMTMVANAYIYRHLLNQAPLLATAQPGLSPYIQQTS